MSKRAAILIITGTTGLAIAGAALTLSPNGPSPSLAAYHRMANGTTMPGAGMPGPSHRMANGTYMVGVKMAAVRPTPGGRRPAGGQTIRGRSTTTARARRAPATRQPVQTLKRMIKITDQINRALKAMNASLRAANRGIGEMLPSNPPGPHP